MKNVLIYRDTYKFTDLKICLKVDLVFSSKCALWTAKFTNSNNVLSHVDSFHLKIFRERKWFRVRFSND